MLPPNPAYALLRWDSDRCKKLYSGSYFEAIRRRLAVRSERKDSSPAVRLGTLVMSIDGAASSPPDPGDPTLLSRIEAHIRESGDHELQQLVKEYLAEV